MTNLFFFAVPTPIHGDIRYRTLKVIADAIAPIYNSFSIYSECLKTDYLILLLPQFKACISKWFLVAYFLQKLN